ncbi:unnamed protein product [Amoebophrya sp. A120]|nr:unnamed protein product [Amoebophrya sp. A120]|eukprot:GSA120T00004297001.1
MMQIVSFRIPLAVVGGVKTSGKQHENSNICCQKILTAALRTNFETRNFAGTISEAVSRVGMDRMATRVCLRIRSASWTKTTPGRRTRVKVPMLIAATRTSVKRTGLRMTCPHTSTICFAFGRTQIWKALSASPAPRCWRIIGAFLRKRERTSRTMERLPKNTKTSCFIT